MRALVLSALIAFLAFNQAGSPPKAVVTGARMTWFGTFTFDKAKEVDEPSAATGKRDILTGIVPPLVNTDRIPFKANTWFGFGYELIGHPPEALVTLKYISKIPPPGLRDAVTGKLKLVSESNWPDLAIGRKDLFRGTSLGSLEDTPTGKWVLQVWHDDHMLLEKTFTVSGR